MPRPPYVVGRRRRLMGFDDGIYEFGQAVWVSIRARVAYRFSLLHVIPHAEFRALLGAFSRDYTMRYYLAQITSTNTHGDMKWLPCDY